jgi:beta-phosphoglucomutase
MNTLIFDLDGTLIDANTLHRDSFRWAVQQVCPSFQITIEMEDYLEGVPSLNKIEYINNTFKTGIDSNEVYRLKQEYTEKNMHTISSHNEMGKVLRELSKKYNMVIASNARSRFVYSAIGFMGFTNFDLILTSNFLPIEKRKPNPYIFLEAMKLIDSCPTKTVIFEDSEVGLTAANLSGAAKVIHVKNSADTVSKCKELFL